MRVTSFTQLAQRRDFNLFNQKYPWLRLELSPEASDMEADERNDLSTTGYKSVIFPTKLIGHMESVREHDSPTSLWKSEMLPITLHRHIDG